MTLLDSLYLQAFAPCCLRRHTDRIRQQPWDRLLLTPIAMLREQTLTQTVAATSSSPRTGRRSQRPPTRGIETLTGSNTHEMHADS